MLPRIHVITDLPYTTPSVLDSVVAAGVDAIQVRAKHLNDRELLDLVSAVIEVVDGRAAVIVNDRLDIALATGADGVHLGLDDLSVAAARRLAPAGFLIGGTCRTVAHARSALSDGADYVGAGPVYASTTKEGLPAPIGLTTLTGISSVLPTIAISGITLERLGEVRAAGAYGVAMIAAVTRAADPHQAAREIVGTFR